jgi:hypothetical protein
MFIAGPQKGQVAAGDPALRQRRAGAGEPAEDYFCDNTHCTS